jgi:hypothetical protein
MRDPFFTATLERRLAGICVLATRVLISAGSKLERTSRYDSVNVWISDARTYTERSTYHRLALIARWPFQSAPKHLAGTVTMKKDEPTDCKIRQRSLPRQTSASIKMGCDDSCTADILAV